MSEPIEITEEVAEKIAEAVPDFTAALRKIQVQYSLLGLAVGTAAGAITAFYIAYRRAETKYSKIADEEIAEMRQHYREKDRARESAAAKRPVEEIVRERGYSSPDTPRVAPPMAVQPPAELNDDDDDSAMAADDVEGPTGIRAPNIPVAPAPPRTQNVFEEHGDEEPPPEWDWHEERKGRSPDIPYVIHYDERDEMEHYDDMTLTYYDADDVMCNDRDEVIPLDQRNLMIGEANLNRFGHGSNSPEIVYVRNDKLEMLFEVIKSPNSYAEEVHGFTHEGWDRGNLERMRVRERDEPED